MLGWPHLRYEQVGDIFADSRRHFAGDIPRCGSRRIAPAPLAGQSQHRREDGCQVRVDGSACEEDEYHMPGSVRLEYMCTASCNIGAMASLCMIRE